MVLGECRHKVDLSPERTLERTNSLPVLLLLLLSFIIIMMMMINFFSFDEQKDTDNILL